MFRLALLSLLGLLMVMLTGCGTNMAVVGTAGERTGGAIISRYDTATVEGVTLQVDSLLDDLADDDVDDSANWRSLKGFLRKLESELLIDTAATEATVQLSERADGDAEDAALARSVLQGLSRQLHSAPTR